MISISLSLYIYNYIYICFNRDVGGVNVGGVKVLYFDGFCIDVDAFAMG